MIFPVCPIKVLLHRLPMSRQDAFDTRRISFRAHEPGGSLPSPFPVFEFWTRVEEGIHCD